MSHDIKSNLTGQYHPSSHYSRTCLERPPHWPKICGLSRQVVSGDRIQLYWNVGPSAKNVCSVKTDGLMGVVSQSRFHCTRCLLPAVICEETGHFSSFSLYVISYVCWSVMFLSAELLSLLNQFHACKVKPGPVTVGPEQLELSQLCQGDQPVLVPVEVQPGKSGVWCVYMCIWYCRPSIISRSENGNSALIKCNFHTRKIKIWRSKIEILHSKMPILHSKTALK